MLFFRYRLFFLLLVPQIVFGISDEKCLNSSFKTIISHKAKPFGIFKNVLTVSKNFCVLEIESKKYEFLNKKWSIDICRLPVHIKYGTGAVDIYKRANDCAPYSSELVGTDYCQKLKELEKIILDEGLIFAEGLKENISSDHGKIYCSYLLLKGYLRKGIVYGPESRKINPDEEIKIPEEKAATPSVSF